MANWIQNLITVETDPVTRLWTGVGSLTIGGHGFTGGGAALSVSAMELTSGEPDRRMKIEISGIPNSLRGKFLQDVGPLPVLIEWVWSSDSGATWNKLCDIQFRGRLSSPSFANGVFSVELETYRGDVDRGSAEAVVSRGSTAPDGGRQGDGVHAAVVAGGSRNRMAALKTVIRDSRFVMRKRKTGNANSRGKKGRVS